MTPLSVLDLAKFPLHHFDCPHQRSTDCNNFLVLLHFVPSKAFTEHKVSSHLPISQTNHLSASFGDKKRIQRKHQNEIRKLFYPFLPLVFLLWACFLTCIALDTVALFRNHVITAATLRLFAVYALGWSKFLHITPIVRRRFTAGSPYCHQLAPVTSCNTQRVH